MTQAVSSSSILSLQAFSLTLSSVYNFVLTVTSKDGRSGTQTVEVTSILTGSPVVYSANMLTKFSVDEKVLSQWHNLIPLNRLLLTNSLAHTLNFSLHSLPLCSFLFFLFLSLSLYFYFSISAGGSRHSKIEFVHSVCVDSYFLQHEG